MAKEKRSEYGYKCNCGKWHDFPAYVIAHQHDVLTHTCPKCKRKNGIYELTVEIEKRPKEKER
jgi:hypothetical protein